MDGTPVIIVVDSAADLGQVKAACELHGLRQLSVLPRLGMLRGLIDPARVVELTQVSGVRSVEREREIQLPPPDSKVQ